MLDQGTSKVVVYGAASIMATPRLNLILNAIESYAVLETRLGISRLIDSWNVSRNGTLG